MKYKNILYQSFQKMICSANSQRFHGFYITMTEITSVLGDYEHEKN